ncbi:MAG: amidohydrolase [Congregibacter sp.]
MGPVDWLFSGGSIFTATGDTAEVVAVRAGEIAYVGPLAGVAALLGSNTRRVDIGDGMLAPGFIDSHAHPVGVGLGLTVHCDVSGISERSRILEKISSCASQRQGEAWLVGRGWALGAFERSMPSAAELDGVLPPGMGGYLTAEDGHNAWASSEAFRRAGVDANTPDPAGGTIERLPDGAPQGTLRERAMSSVSSYLPAVSEAQQEVALTAALARFNSYGVTTVVAAGIDASRVGQYQRLRDANTLTTRSVLAMWVGSDWEEDFALLEALLEREDTMLRVSQIKLMLDGVLENQTAHISFDYPGLGHRGSRFFETEETLVKWAIAFEALGYQLHFHTVGDAAISQGLRVLEASRDARGAGNIRPIFAHDYLVKPTDYTALRDSGAYMQLTMLWDQQNDSMVSLNKPSLSEKQYAELMPAESLIAAGIPVIGGSDAPVGQSNPLSSIQVAVTGQGVPYFDGGDMSPQTLMPGGRVSLVDMLRAYTIEAARAIGMDELVGSIEVGKRADLVLLDRDLLTIPATEIYGTAARLTLLNGDVVYERSTPGSKN